jgi:exonuclease VII small subunit
MAYLSESKSKAMPLNEFMAQYIKGLKLKKRASEALEDYKRARAK